MDWIIFIIGMIVGVILLEVGKHFLIRKTGKFIFIIIILVVLFIVFSAIFIKTDTFKDNSAIKTGAAIADVFTSGTEEVRNEGTTAGSSLFNSTFKKE
ncbi:MAG: hypothetical protein V1645_00130 [archaeon]